MKRNADQIFNKYCKLLYKISIIMLCSEEDAYDAVQESFLKYLNTKKDFNEIYTLSLHDALPIL